MMLRSGTCLTLRPWRPHTPLVQTDTTGDYTAEADQPGGSSSYLIVNADTLTFRCHTSVQSLWDGKSRLAPSRSLLARWACQRST